MKIWKILVIIGSLIFIALTAFVIGQSNSFGLSINFDEASKYGGLLAGLFTFLSVLLLFFNLQNQINSTSKAAFESRFFELIKYHRDNVSEMKYRSPNSSTNTKVDSLVEGKMIFKYIHREIETAIGVVTPFFKNKIADDYYLNETIKNDDQKNPTITNYNISINQLNIYNIAYLIVFFGVAEQGAAILNTIFEKKYNKEFYLPIIQKCTNIPAKYSKYSIWDILKLDKKCPFTKYYGGHQIRLGHYFRNLYQAVKYVDSSNLFIYAEKYEYVRMLRAQLSTYEQAVFLFNSLSVLGRVWEIDAEDNNFDKQLITKYDMIRNVPAEFITSINPSKIYPNVDYERGDGKTNERKAMENKYS